MVDDVSDAELLAYLDEMLPDARAVVVERLLRNSAPLRARAAALNEQRDQGGRSLGEIWRRFRLSCPSRSEMASHVLGVLDTAASDYVRFHLEIVGCPMCQANCDDLNSLQANLRDSGSAQTRRERFFESSAGLLNRRDE